MSDYGFNYFLERGSVLTEMARPVSVFTSLDKDLAPIQDTYIKLMNKVGPLVGKDTGKRQFFIYAYLLSQLMDVAYPDVDMDVGKFAQVLTGRPGRDFNTMKSAFLKAAQDKKEIVNSPQFAADALNDANIENYYNIRNAVGGSRRTGYENEVQSVLGTSSSDFRDVSTQAEPLVAQLNKIMGARKSQRTRGKLGSPDAPQQAAQGGNPNVDFAYSITDAIDALLENREEYLKALKTGQVTTDSLQDSEKLLMSDAARDLILTVKGMYDDMISQQTGTTPSEFEEQMKKMISEVSPKKAIILNMIVDEVHDLADFTSSMADLQNSIGSGEKSYEGYDKDVLAKILDTPEKMELFDKWYDFNTQWRKAKNDKLEELWIRKLIQQNFFDRKGIEDNKQDRFMSPDIQALMNQQAQIYRAMEDESNPEKQAAYKKKLDTITKEIKFKRGEGNTPAPEEQEESGVMEYMTEQVSKDNHNVKKEKGKFVDRGFRKPINYAHWLHINQ